MHIINPKSIKLNISTFFNFYLDIKGLFYREFNYLQYFLN